MNCITETPEGIALARCEASGLEVEATLQTKQQRQRRLKKSELLACMFSSLLLSGGVGIQFT
jgi:hypothetical protein